MEPVPKYKKGDLVFVDGKNRARIQGVSYLYLFDFDTGSFKYDVWYFDNTKQQWIDENRIYRTRRF